MGELSRVQQLLDEILDSERSPEEVCGDCPELLPEVRRRWQQMRRVDAELNALFPTPGTSPDADTPAPWPPGGPDLPRIPGYEVEAVLGHGGMGIVYKARHLRLNRTVALKMLLAGAYVGLEQRERFLREAEAVAGLRHANIVQVHDVGDHGGRPYFTMEYVEGGSLAQKLLGAPHPAREATSLLVTLAEAVQVAHQGGIVHRDLKPANILLAVDGTPKIADFGLARHFDGGPALTLSGARVGTPSYMAPEQAMGKTHTIGPAADIYALGAVLYEMLTGRPPFRGETAAETELQVICQEPVPPSRLNPRVPRDLETICLKCLHKEPDRRYATAAALAADLRRFQQGEPITARPAGLLERTGKWVRRHPTRTAVLAASLLLVTMLVSGAVWLTVQRAQRRNAVEADLKELAGLEKNARWAKARAVLERAEARLEGGGPDDLRRRLDAARRDLDLVIRLDAIRLSRATSGELSFYKQQTDRDYQAAFREAGLGTFQDEPATVAAAVKTSPVRGALVAALDDWVICISDKKERDWLFEVTRQAHPAPEGWRARIIDSAAWDDRAALAELAQTVPVARKLASLSLALGERLRAVDGDAIPLLKRVQKAYPADFWANLILGNALLQGAPQEAAGYYRAALASRPEVAVGYCAVGDALRLQSLLAEASEYFEKAIQLDPSYARAHSNLGLTLQLQGRLVEAIDCFRRAVRLDPNYAWAHHNLANALRLTGRLDEAHAHCRQARHLEPNNSEIENNMRSVLVQRGRGREAQAGWRKALDAGPSGYDAWAGYAELCLFLEMPEEYRRARRELLERFGAITSPFLAESLGRAGLLLPGTEAELRQAAALTDRAVAARGSTPAWIYRYFLFARGLADYRQGRLANAISIMEGEGSRVMGPAPRLVLAMAQHAQGQIVQARKTLAAAVLAFNWSAEQADCRDVWIIHILRREAEAMILPSLPAFLEGKYQPADDAERLALVAVCQLQGRYHAAARLYADAFAAEPELAERLAAECGSRAARADEQPVGRVEDLSMQCRHPAARCAALAGYGLGKDGANLSDTERTRWRRQARAWLHADLTFWAKMLDNGSRPAQVQIRKMLTQWQADPDLAGLREPSALDRLARDERKECLALWQEVAAVLERVKKAQ
jgi:serine/threonine-protein kinase